MQNRGLLRRRVRSVEEKVRLSIFLSPSLNRTECPDLSELWWFRVKLSRKNVHPAPEQDTLSSKEDDSGVHSGRYR